ncbi:MAG: tRNA lysidine(34) synthetase TilS, partial [Muribaculaceae bacterium]|nr:tRNA lysidine(34) synthetase TilS [Muribaculaceae bacterium]
RSMAFLADNKTFYTRAVTRRAEAYRDSDTGDIDLGALALDPDAGLLLYEMLRGEGFSRRQTDDMLSAATRSGGVFIAGGTSRSLDHGYLRAPRAARQSKPGAVDVSLLRDIFSPIHIEITRHDVSSFKPERDSRVIYIDERALAGEPRWQLRPWRRGDRLEPFGLEGSRLVSDIFADARLDAASKQQTWLLWRDETLMWVVGRRASRHFTVGPSTRRYLKLKLID